MPARQSSTQIWYGLLEGNRELLIFAKLTEREIECNYGVFCC
jgi:hypothetical protein